jgi:hypothetical protein
LQQQPIAIDTDPDDETSGVDAEPGPSNGAPAELKIIGFFLKKLKR